jgi:PEP-CTERM motif
MKKILIAASISGLALYLPQTEAALFEISYTFGDNTLEGTIDGTLQVDNNKVAVNSMQNLTFNGAAGPSLLPVYNADKFYSELYPAFYPMQPGFPTETTPWLTLDGSYMNFLACPAGDCNNGFAFIVADSLAAVLGGSAYIAGSSWGFTHEEFVPANWQMSAVPVPGALWLFGSALAGFSFFGRRKEA